MNHRYSAKKSHSGDSIFVYIHGFLLCYLIIYIKSYGQRKKKAIYRITHSCEVKLSFQKFVFFFSKTLNQKLSLEDEESNKYKQFLSFSFKLIKNIPVCDSRMERKRGQRRQSRVGEMKAGMNFIPPKFTRNENWATSGMGPLYYKKPNSLFLIHSQ